MASKRSLQESIPDYEAMYNKAYDEVMKEKIEFRKYFSKSHLETMPQIEKIVFTNRLRNHLILKKLGLNIGTPDFLSKSHHQRKIAFLNSRENDETWTPGMERTKTRNGIDRFYARRKARNADVTFLQGKEVTASAVSNGSQPLELHTAEKQQPFMGFRRILARRLLNHLRHELAWKKFLRQSLANRLIDVNECEVLDPSDELKLEKAMKKKQADYRNELRNRYPRRKISEKNYSELEVPNEDEYILCEECNEEYLHGNCPVHGPVEFVKDKTGGQVEQRREKGRQHEAGVLKMPQNTASRSIPDGLIIAPSKMHGAGFGVWTRRTFPQGTMFGPYGGVKVYSEMAAHASGYTWEIYKDGRLDHYVDAQDVSKSNWMRYVNCANSKSVQNVKAFQFSGSIYYRACVDIPVNVEMVVWYGEEYAEELGLVAKEINSLGCHEAQDGPNLHPVKAIPRRAEHRPKMTSFIADQNQTQDHQTGCRNDAHSHVLDGADKQHHVLDEEKLRRQCSDGKERRHKCSLCSKAFTRKQSLICHMRIHTGEKPYACSVCGLRFSQQGSLNKHMRIHTGEKPYVCTVCGVKFSQQPHLNGHMRIHTGEKPYTCTVCGMGFNDHSNLHKHMRIHTGEKPYVCPVCGVRFTHSFQLKRHKEKH